MGKIEYTKEQQRVIDIRDKNVLVSAAAGSGKTAVLTARIVSRITDPDPLKRASIDRMLIVTFTEAAAGEMRERILKAIAGKRDANPKDEYLRTQQTMVHSALIMTVHGFCLYLIRNHFDQIGLDPSFRVAAEEETGLLFADSMEEALAKLREEQPEEYEALLDHFDLGIRQDKLKSVVEDLHRIAMSQAFPSEWFVKANALLGEYENHPELSPVFTKESELENRILKDVEEQLLRAVELAREPMGPANYLPALEEDLSFARTLLSLPSQRERSAQYRTHEFPKLKQEKASELKNLVQGIRNDCKARIQAIAADYYYLPFDELVADEISNVRILKALLQLTESAAWIYAANKRANNLIDFSDMEHFALEILYQKDGKYYVPTEIAKGYQDYFDEVMVDEYQDSNDIQETLLSAVSKPDELTGNRFMVGDVKQSIYRFRLARPEIFQHKFDTYSLSEDARDVRIDLSSNFRSRKEVLDSVNRVFENTMFRQIGGVEYDEAAMLRAGLPYPDDEGKGTFRTELLVLPEESWRNGEKMSCIEWEAYAAAGRIQRMIAEGLPVTGGKGEEGFITHPVRYSDIMILLKKAKNRASKVKAIFESMGIPTVVISKEGYFMAPEVILLLNVISIIDNPRQDIPLLGVLHSFFGGFTEEELAEIRGNHSKELLYDSLKRYRDSGKKAELKEKITAFLDKLNAYRTFSDEESVYELIKTLIENEGIDDYYRAMKLGEQRIANIRILLDKAKEFAATGYVGLFEFVRYIENVKSNEIDFGEANIQDENANVVRIYTMHKSKGLEFPVCFVLGCGANLVSGLDRKTVPVLSDTGMGIDFADPVRRVRHVSFARNVIQKLEDLEKRGEDLRLLYVAMTRAREKLILIGKCGKTMFANMGKFGPNRKFTLSEVQNASTFMHLLLPIAEANPELFDVAVVNREDVMTAETIQGAERELLKKELLQVRAGEAFEPFVYPHQSLKEVFTKTSVSDLKRASVYREEEEEGKEELYKDEEKYSEFGKKEAYVPMFLREEEKKATGAMYGTAYHRVMELLDLKAFPDLSSDTESLREILRKQRKDCIGKLYLTKEEDRLVREEKVLKFLESSLAARMQKAHALGRLYREQPFVLSVPASDLNPDFPAEEKVLVQGVIDAYFEEDGELVLVDYKTDANVDEKELKARHSAQLSFYKKALEKLERKPVKEVLIYSVFLGEVIVL